MRRDEDRGSRKAALLLLLLTVSQAIALDRDDIGITRQGRAYQAQLTFDVTAPPNRVASVLTDYEHPNRLTPDVTRREVINRRNGITRVRTEIHSCILFFCKNVVLTQDVTVIADTIEARIVPEESDFGSGHLLWQVMSNDSGGSHIRFESIIEPDFLIPPLIGGFFFRKRLQEQIFSTAENLEREAAREPPALANPD